MKSDNMEKKIKQAFSNATPDVLDSVLSACDSQKGRVIVMTQPKNKNIWIKSISGIAAALVILLGGFIGFRAYENNYLVDSTVSLDVNPSIEIQVNAKEKVLQVNPLNEDGQQVVEGMNFEGSDLNVTVNALIGSMLRNGYITELANSILISVNNEDQQKGAALQEKLTQEVSNLLQTDSFDGAILSQTVTGDAQLQTLAETYGITLGKAQLIQQLVNQNPLYTFEGLVSLSINELNLLSESIHTNLENVNSIGVASDKDYIGVEKAQSIAFSHAGITEADVLGLHTKLDYEDGLMVYDVEFYAGEYEYDYEINAKTGDVVKSEKDWEEFPSYTNSSNHTANQGPSNNSSSSSGNTGNTGAATAYMDAAAAKQTVLAHAGVQEADIYDYDVDFDYDHGVAVYEIEFKSSGYEYDYEINAQTGEIYKNEKKYDDDYHHTGGTSSGAGNGSGGSTSSGNSSSSASTAYIDAAAAKQAALSHAGVKEADIREYEIELDYDNGVMVYEIEFKAGNYEYEYEINAETGNVMKNEKDRDD